MIFFRRDNIANFATPAEGDTPIDLTIAAPFAGLVLTADAIGEVLRLHDARFDGGRDADLSRANLRGAEVKARFGHSIKTAMERYVQPIESKLSEKAEKAGLGAL